jgi:hypothetical protein
LSFAYQGLGRREDVIECHKAARDTLKAAAERHRGVVSRVADLQENLAIVDYNLAGTCEGDLARYYARYRAAWAEAYAICDKLELFGPLSDDLRTVLAMASYQRADLRAEDGESPDLEDLARAERLWDELRRRQPGSLSHRALLAMVRHELAEDLESLGRDAEARACRERANAGARGDGPALFEAAVAAAGNALLTGTYPTKLDAGRLAERRRRLARRAVTFVRQAIAEGFRDAARLHAAPELSLLCADPEYRAAVASLDDSVFPSEPFAARP